MNKKSDLEITGRVLKNNSTWRDGNTQAQCDCLISSGN